MNVLPSGTSYLVIKIIVLDPGGILVPNTSDSRTISFANEFSYTALVGPLTRCLYYIYAPVVGSMTTLV